ncbi:DEAD/DEAH box helicase [Brevundimonas sp. NPDC092305]|uniref:DEAD/DEAH box helicase n=1 Tax=Brevundimonas sp. NPDC092305 TaxID=3363957 RepID=UPI0037F19ED7
MTDTIPKSGPLPLVDGPAPLTERPKASVRPPAAAIAARLAQACAASRDRDVIFVAASERRADEIARAMQAFAASEPLTVLVFPPWDCLPYDRALPSRESMGRRMAVLAHLARQDRFRCLVVTSPEAMMQRVAPAKAACDRFDLVTGETLDRDALRAFADRTGYLHDERIDEPGEIAILGEVVDVYPPAAATPFRIVLQEDGRIAEIKAFDPLTQRSQETASAVQLTPASEWVDQGEPPTEAGRLDLAEHYGMTLGDLFALLPDGDIVLDGGVGDRIEQVADQIREAFEARRDFGGPEEARPTDPDKIYLTADDAFRALEPGRELEVDKISPPPAFALERAPGSALKRYVVAQQDKRRTIVIAGLAHELKVIARLLKRAGLETPDSLDGWDAVARVRPGGFVSILADLDGGYEDAGAGLVVLTPTDITGGRLARGGGVSANPFGDTDIRPGDVVIHEDHGLGVLQALDTIEADGVQRDIVRLEYHGGATVLAPVEEFDRIWRYSSEPSTVTLDRLNTQGWATRRAEVSAQIDATAAHMVEMSRARAAAGTTPVAPPSAAYARFAARFPFPESADQLSAIKAVLEDLASGRPMNRLVCGDVGFGKTEVALRAAAAVALSGRQTLLAAPTTVLARQHYETFQKRFEGTGVKIAHLSRIVDAAESRAVKAGLADGSIQIVVGTQSLADDKVAFADLALVVIDEEHRFGAKLKADLAARAPHLLAMSATPIPRTLQSALVGVQDVSIIASPPARRRPIRTFLADYDAGSLRSILLREKSRSGQSFVVAPRIEDLESLAVELKTVAPEAHLVVAHGKLSADELDSVMTGFANGRGDILLATNIIENGLDVPRANTMVVWRPDRFGLAQLHQLRGRVGRGRRQGFAYLLSDPTTPMAETTRARLQTLEALDRLGAGFAVSARDLDLRGGGDLVGDEQAGHIRLIGASLYQRVLGQAIRAAGGEADPEALRPKLNLPVRGSLPEDYIPDPVVRINLYARLAQLTTADGIDALHEEIEDRFGPLPDAAEALVGSARLTALAVAAGVTEVVSGPKAMALTFGRHRAEHLSARIVANDERRWSGARLILESEAARRQDLRFLETVLDEMAAA